MADLRNSTNQRDFLMPSLAKDITVYVVDDDGDVLTSLKFLLETEGFRVLTFRSAAELLNSTAAKQADCFVIDYKMSQMNGIDLAVRLRSRSSGTPIILITGDPDNSINVRAADAGIRHVLRKPHLEGSLIGLITAAVAGESDVHSRT
jgi:two-component system, LuxR family, response regulator FixJ